jgi:hypothetical protein
MAVRRALTLETLGAWLLKATGARPSTHAHVHTGFAGVSAWCVQPTYRTELVEAGQPVLLWISGNDRECPAGIYAHGRTTGIAADDVVPLALSPLSAPLLRSELVGRAELERLEVLRVPAGSNPSYVTPDQLRVLAAMCPELGEASA